MGLLVIFDFTISRWPKGTMIAEKTDKIGAEPDGEMQSLFLTASGIGLLLMFGVCSMGIDKSEWSSMKQVSARRLSALWFVGTLVTSLGLAALGLAGLGVFGAGSVYAAAETNTGSSSSAVDSKARFQQLDAEVEQILDDVVNLGADMAVLEEARELSPKTQLLVLVSIDPSAFFQMEAIELKVDGHTAAFHQYSGGEVTALSQGGSHRLFWDNVPAGRHQLTALLMGSVPKDPDFQRESTLMIISGVGRRVVELRVATGKNQAFPDLSIKEWK